MQRHISGLPRPAVLHRVGALGWVAGCVVLAAGCGSKSTPAPPPAATAPRYPGVELVVACADPGFARTLSGPIAGWTGRTGAKATVQAKPKEEGPTVDVLVIRPYELGELGARDALTPLPSAFTTDVTPLDYPSISAKYREMLGSWAGAAVALPLAGDGYVLAYRADKFQDEQAQRAFQAGRKRPLAPPATWEEALDVAAFFAGHQKAPSLPPVPADPDRLLTEFHQIAACYDREARSEFQKQAAGDALAFHVATGTWTPRLDAPAFAAAAEWLANARPYRMPTPTDPVAALSDGSAVLAVLTLAEVGRLPKDSGGAIDPRFRVAALPGTQAYFAPDGRRTTVGGGGNYVPYLGSRGWLAVVRKGSPNADAAWNLLAELASPAALLARVSDPAADAGPVRTDHATADRSQLWLRYGFDAARTKQLADAVAKSLRFTVTNPAIVLRTPDRVPRMAALEASVRKAATGQTPPADAMREAQAAWLTMDAAANAEELTRWRRQAVNLP